MSQVLIGIIGVILFIGLALAGALFLGPRFQESANTSKASASVQAVAQVAAAYNMFRVQEGSTPADVAALVTGDYLKSAPANPTGGAALSITSGRVEMAVAGNSEEICDAIQKQSTGSDAKITSPTGAGGCYVDDATTPTTFTAYATL